MAEDRDLLTAWRAGDEAAGEVLFDRYYAAIARFFANKVPDDPADLIQDTFMACVKGRDRLREDSSFRSYLFATACNVVREHYRAQRRDLDRFDLASQSAADLAPGAGTMLAERADQRVLLEALRRVPVEMQILLELFYWEDMTSAAIAEVLALPHGTVRTRLRRARQLLEDELAKLRGGDEILRSTALDLAGWAAGLRACQRGGA